MPTFKLPHALYPKAADAQDSLRRCGVPIGADFHTLSSTQVDAVLREATRVRYRKPHNANGSTARYFHAYLQRLARGGRR